MALAGLPLLASPSAGLSEALDAAAVCDLLTGAEVEAVQGQAVTGRHPSESPSTSFRVVRCAYRTEDFTSSVSVALGEPLDGRPDGPRAYWRTRFHPEGGFTGKEEPPRPVEGLGDEAFWTGDAVAGSLYVLAGDRFVRVSVGGVPESATREERSRELAARVLARLADR
ncbi:MAG: hypothetical protein R3325_14540 [Thermoanaerobaculia bacterium]|nr:hypothetical protein [Thermoanaerobaculia bacterium]